MVSLATILAYEDLEPIIAKLGCRRPDKLREQLACLLAYHSCEGGSTAIAYAWGDLLTSIGVEPFGLSCGFYFRHPVVAWRVWRNKRRAQLEQSP